MGWESDFEMNNDNINADTYSTAASTRQGFVYSAVDSVQRCFNNIADDAGREEYFKSNQAHRINKKRGQSQVTLMPGSIDSFIHLSLKMAITNVSANHASALLQLRTTRGLRDVVLFVKEICVGDAG
jgi:hypothetical protein